MEFKHLSLIELADLVKNNTATPEEIYAYFYARTVEHNPELGAFTTLPILDPSINSSTNSALPIAVKDIFCEV